MNHFINGFHLCDLDRIYGDWRIIEEESVVYIKDIIPYLELKNKQLVKFNNISWKGKDLDYKLNDERYNKCDVRHPCILTVGKNPHNCKYRMIDGRHRMTKMINMGLNESLFYIIDFDIIVKQLRPKPLL